jgi:hypothetical protein
VDLNLDEFQGAVLHGILDGDGVDGLVDILGEQFTLSARPAN